MDKIYVLVIAYTQKFMMTISKGPWIEFKSNFCVVMLYIHIYIYVGLVSVSSQRVLNLWNVLLLVIFLNPSRHFLFTKSFIYKFIQWFPTRQNVWFPKSNMISNTWIKNIYECLQVLTSPDFWLMKINSPSSTTLYELFVANISIFRHLQPISPGCHFTKVLRAPFSVQSIPA